MSLTAHPEQLIATIHRWGVQLVRSEAPVLPVNPLLAGLPPRGAGPAGGFPRRKGMVIFCSSTLCELGRDTILIGTQRCGLR